MSFRKKKKQHDEEELEIMDLMERSTICKASVSGIRCNS